MIKKVIIITILVFWVLVCAKEEEVNNKYVIGWTTSETDTINGIGVCFERLRLERNTINGVDLQVPGGGWFSLLTWMYVYSWNGFNGSYPTKKELDDWIHSPAFKEGSETNGVVLSLFGHNNKKINGLSISGWTSLNSRLHGVSINPFQNNIFLLNGLAIGVLNGSYEMTGCQLGIWNRGNIVHGAQVGVLINHADEVNGLQLGLINYTDLLNGCQIGLFNMYHNQTIKIPNIRAYGNTPLQSIHFLIITQPKHPTTPKSDRKYPSTTSI